MNTTNAYFNGIYMNQIVAGGEQVRAVNSLTQSASTHTVSIAKPEEASRTHPYHYRNYNLAAMFVNARISAYASGSKDIYSKPTKQGATIHDAVNLAMAQSPAKTDEENYLPEMYPNVASAASIYGDADGKYLAFMKSTFGPDYISQPFILWNAPFASGEASGQISSTASTGASKPTTSNHVSSAFSPSTDSMNTFLVTLSVFLLSYLF